MKTRLEMAHEYLIKMIGCPNIPAMNAEQISSAAFDLVDAMIAEHHKRNYQEVQDGSEWQPDWSQAPEGYDYWVATADYDGKISGGWFYDVEPEFGYGKEVSIYYSSNSNPILTKSFGYQGDWRDSLRKRPK